MKIHTSDSSICVLESRRDRVSGGKKKHKNRFVRGVNVNDVIIVFLFREIADDRECIMRLRLLINSAHFARLTALDKNPQKNFRRTSNTQNQCAIDVDVKCVYRSANKLNFVSL